MPPRSLNRREYGEFKRMLEQALLEIRLPAGIVDSENIIPGSIRPQNCKMDANWNFTGNVSGGGIKVGGFSQTTTEQPSIAVSNYSDSETSSTTSEPQDSKEDIVFLNALKRKVIYTLPPVSKNVGRKMHIKRIDKDTTKICRILTYEDDKIDDTDRVELGAQQAVIVIASSTQWHVFAKFE